MEGDNGDRSKVLAYHSVLYVRIPRIRAPRIGEKATTFLLRLHVVSNYASFSNFVSMEGRVSISNCALSVFSDAWI